MRKASLILSGILLISTNVISGTNCYKTWDGSYSCKDSGSKYSTSVYKDRMNGGYESYDFNTGQKTHITPRSDGGFSTFEYGKDKYNYNDYSFGN